MVLIFRNLESLWGSKHVHVQTNMEFVGVRGIKLSDKAGGGPEGKNKLVLNFVISYDESPVKVSSCNPVVPNFNTLPTEQSGRNHEFLNKDLISFSCCCFPPSL